MARILVIDDNTTLRMMMHETLAKAGHEVVEACNGHEGTERAAAESFDLVITDIIMPDKEGIATIVELRRNYPDLKIIAASAGGKIDAKEYLETAKEFGADRTLVKPFGRKDILEAVDQVLSGQPVQQSV